MIDFEESDGRLEGGGEEAGPGQSPPLFDPLFEPWPDAPAPARPGEPAGALSLTPPFAEAFPAQTEDALAWELPASAVLRQEFQTGVSGYPDRYLQPYAERMTELQRVLRESTITVPRPEHRWLITVRELAETLLLAALIFLSVRASFQNFRVEGASMQPSLENGEYLIVNKLAYAQLDTSLFDWLPFYESGDQPVQHIWGEPSRGDIIVFRAPTSINRDFIKRVIGLPGDTVEINESAGEVLVNGSALTEPYIQGSTACNGQCKREIPQANTPESEAACGSSACYFVMGDNRQNSSDSRQGWLVPEENIIGKALVTYWHNGGPKLDLAPNHSVGLASDANAEE